MAEEKKKQPTLGEKVVFGEGAKELGNYQEEPGGGTPHMGGGRGAILRDGRL